MTTYRNAVGLLIFSSFVSLTGCQSAFTTRSAQPVPLEAANSNSVTVEIRPASGKPVMKQLAQKQGMRLQDVLEAAKPKFRNREVYIVRESPKTGQKHKLATVYDGATRRMTMETDYAILPGDRVVIAQDTTTSLEKAVSGFLGRS